MVSIATATADGNPTRERDFDPVVASATMHAIAARIAPRVRNGKALERELARKAIDELRRAQEWLTARFADLGMSGQLPFVTDEEDEERIYLEALIYTLRYAATQTLYVHGLVYICRAE